MKDSSKYKGESLSFNIVFDIIDDETYSTGHKLSTIMEHVRGKFCEGGGEITKNLENIVLRVLIDLELCGRANNIKKDIWRIAQTDQQIWGDDGSEWVYLYYFSDDKNKAQDKENKYWRCNIGYAEKDPEGRVKR